MAVGMVDRAFLVGPDQVRDLERTVGAAEHSEIHPVERPRRAAGDRRQEIEKADVEPELAALSQGSSPVRGEPISRFVSRTPPSQRSRQALEHEPTDRFAASRAATTCRFAQSVGATRTTPTQSKRRNRAGRCTPRARTVGADGSSWESLPLGRGIFDQTRLDRSTSVASGSRRIDCGPYPNTLDPTRTVCRVCLRNPTPSNAFAAGIRLSVIEGRRENG